MAQQTGAGNETGAQKIDSRKQLVELLKNLLEKGESAQGTEEQDPLEVDDYDFGNFEESEEEDYERLSELLEKLKQVFVERTDDLINLFFDDDDENENRVTALSAAQKVRQLDRITSFFRNPTAENEASFNEVLKALLPWKLPKLLEVLEGRQKELLTETATENAPDTITSSISWGSLPSLDLWQRVIKTVNGLIAEKGKEALIPPLGLRSKQAERVLGLSKATKGSSISGSFGFGLVAPEEGVQPSTSGSRISLHPPEASSQVIEKYSRFGRKITKQNLIDAGILAVDQPDNPIELKWVDIDTKTLPEGAKPLVSLADGYLAELGKDYASEISSVTSLLYLQDAEKTIPFYEKYFHGKEHINFMAMGDGNAGAICVSVEVTKEREYARAIIRTKQGEDRILIPASPKPKEVLKTLKGGYPEYEKLKFAQIKDLTFPDELLSMERKLMFKTYKWGVLYCKAGQTDEVEMFQNVDESPAFQEFLEFLGQKVKLQGWTNFRGGLDVKNNSTGTHSIYTTFRNFEIMYHVSTMLPYNAEDLQQLERKRHLGNDIVVIIFKEGDTLYAPTTIRSEFNHVFCVIQKEDAPPDAPTRYRVNFTCKSGVKPFYPLLTSGSYEKNDAFRELLLTKLINAERMAFYAPDFAQKMLRTRKMMLESLYTNFVKKDNE